MFKKNNQNDYQQGYYPNVEWNRIFYEIDEINRKLRNLNNRLRRVENFLGLSVEEEIEVDKNTGTFNY